MNTMLTDKKLVLIVILTLINAISVQQVESSKVLTLSDESDDENTLRQALYLVKLLKTDYMRSLRENNDLEVNGDDEANSTCPEDANDSTTPIALTSVVESVPPTTTMVLPAMPANAAPAYRIEQPPAPLVLPAQFVQPAPAMPPTPATSAPQATYPPQPMIQYTPPGVMPPAENFKYPYRYYHRRLMPDYGYYDVLLTRYTSPGQSYAPTSLPGLFRRYGYDVPIFATRYENNFQAQYRQQYYNPASELPLITENIFDVIFIDDNRVPVGPLLAFVPTGYRRVGDAGPVTNATLASEVFRLNETTTETTTPSQQTNVSEGNNMTRTTTVTLTTKEANVTTASLTQATAATLTSLSPTTTSIKSSATTKNVLTSRDPTKSNIRHRIAVTKAQSKFTKKARAHRFRRPKTTEEKSTIENVLLSQVASELMNEFKGSKTENNVSMILRHGSNNTLSKPKQNNLSFRSTMKIHLQGSSRIQIPFPENNAFCHLYPQSQLCGAGI